MLSPRSVRRNICTLVKKLSPSDSGRKNSGKLQLARGCVAIYVGEERKRYQVPLTYLSLPTFQELINRSNDDAFDVKIDGPITVACATQAFDRLLKIAKKTAYSKRSPKLQFCTWLANIDRAYVYAWFAVRNAVAAVSSSKGFGPF